MVPVPFHDELFMARLLAFLPLLCSGLTLLHATPLPASPTRRPAFASTPHVEAGELVLDLGGVRRGCRVEDNGALTTVRLQRERISVDVTAREFQLRFADGTVLTPGDFPSARCEPLPADLGEHGLTVVYQHEQLRVKVHYYGDAGHGFAYKQLELSATGDAAPPALTDVEFESWSGQFHGGGSGHPAFSTHLFAAVEHPAGFQHVTGDTFTATLKLNAEPSLDEDADRFVYPDLPRVVFGVASADDSPADVFRHAVTAVRTTMRRQVVHAVHATDGNLDIDTIRREVDAVGRQWIRDQDARLHGVLLSEGWSSGEFIPDTEVFPAGLGPLGRSLKERRIGLGLALPFEGREWNAEPTTTGLLVDPEHRRNVLLGLMQRHRETELSHVLHDMHTASVDVRAVEQVRAWIRAERRFSPDVVVHWAGPSTSPWWLLDFNGRSETLPAPDPVKTLTPFPDRLTREDARVRQRMNEGWPSAALIVSANGAPPRSAEQWAELWLMRLGRGQETLLLPPHATTWDPDTATTVGQMWTWARNRRAILEETAVWFGGDPGRGEVYGYLHRHVPEEGDPQAILILRNPSAAPAPVSLPETSIPWLQTYPFTRTVPRDEPLPVPGHGVLCVETFSAIRQLAEIPQGPRFRVGDSAARRLEFDLLLSPGETAEFEWLDTETQETRGSTAAALSRGTGRRPPVDWDKPDTADLQATANVLQWRIPNAWCYRGETTRLGLWIDAPGLREGAGARVRGNAAMDVTAASADGWRRWQIELLDSPPEDGTFELRVQTTGSWPRGKEFRARLVLHREERLETATVAYSHPLRSSRDPVMPAQPSDRLIHSRVLFDAPVMLTPKPQATPSQNR